MLPGHQVVFEELGFNACYRCPPAALSAYLEQVMYIRMLSVEITASSCEDGNGMCSVTQILRAIIMLHQPWTALCAKTLAILGVCHCAGKHCGHSSISTNVISDRQTAPLISRHMPSLQLHDTCVFKNMFLAGTHNSSGAFTNLLLMLLPFACRKR